MMTESDLDRIIKAWATSYNEEVLQYAQPAAVNDSEVNFIMLTLLLCPKIFRCGSISRSIFLSNE